MPDINDDYPDNGSIKGTIRLNSSTTGKFERGLDLDWFETTLEKGQRYQFTLWEPGFNPSSVKGYEILGLALYDESGKQVTDFLSGTNLEYPILDFVAPSTGVYYIGARSLYRWDGIGNYSLIMLNRYGEDDYSDNPATVGRFEVTGRAVGRFEAGGDRDWFKFHADSGVHYSFFADGSLVGTSSDLLQPSFIKVHDSNGNLAPMHGWMFDPEESGDYYLEVIGLHLGKYSVGVKAVPDDFPSTNRTKGVLLPKAVLQGRSDYDNDFDRVKLVLDGQKFYTVSLNSEPTFFTLFLYDANGNRLDYLTGATDIKPVQLEIHPLVQGVYYLDVLHMQATNVEVVVPYTLTLSAGIQDDYGDTAKTASNLSPLFPVNGTFEGRDDFDVFKVALKAGARYAFSISAKDSSANSFSITVIDGDEVAPLQFDGTNISNSVKFGASTWLNFTPATSGDFYLKLGPAFEGARNYTVQFVDVSNDNQAPMVIAQSIKSGEKDIPLTTSELTFSFNEPCLISNSTFYLLNSNNSVVPYGYWNKESSGGRTFSIDGNKLTFKLAQFLQPGTYTFVFPTNAIQDLAGNKYDGPQKFTFSTTAASAVGTPSDDVLYGSLSSDIDAGGGVDTVLYSYSRQGFHLTKQGDVVFVEDIATHQGDRLKNIEKIQFINCSVNLEIGASAKKVFASELKILEELYVSFFNRIPDADGLNYWLNRFMNGMSLDSIAESFYGAAIQFADLTGYSPQMSNTDFVRGIYANVLGRKGSSAPTEQEASYWARHLDDMTETKGGLVRTMLSAAHSFKGDSNWGWVADLLDNKASVAHYFAVEQALSYNSPEENITRCSAIAAAISPESVSQALALIGVQDPNWTS